MEYQDLWKEMLSWQVYYMFIGFAISVLGSSVFGANEARFLLRKYGKWKGLKKYESKHPFYLYSLLYLWYDRYYPVNQPEYKKFKRAINKSRIINILGIQLMCSLLLVGIKQYIWGTYFCDLKDVEIVETFRDTSRRLIIAYAVMPSILLNAAQAIMNRMDRKRG